MKKLSLLLLLSITTVSLFAKKQVKSSAKESFSDKVYRLRREVDDLYWEEKEMLDEHREILSEMNSISNCSSTIYYYDGNNSTLDKVIQKIDKGEITYWNEEIGELNSKLWDINNRINNISKNIDNLNRKKAKIDCQLELNPKFKNLVSEDDLCSLIGEYNSFYKNEWTPALKRYNSQAKEFRNKVWVLGTEDSTEDTGD